MDDEQTANWYVEGAFHYADQATDLDRDLAERLAEAPDFDRERFEAAAIRDFTARMRADVDAALELLG